MTMIYKNKRNNDQSTTSKDANILADKGKYGNIDDHLDVEGKKRSGSG